MNVCFNAQTYGVDVAFDPQTQAGLPLVKGHLQYQGFSWCPENQKEVNHFV